MTMSEIDLSIGSSVFLCGVVAATLATQGNVPLLLVVLATLGTGVALGAIQGLWVVVFGIPSFIATLAGLLAFRGLGLLWTNAATVGPVPPAFGALSESFIPPNTSYVIIAIAAAIGIVAIVLRDRSRNARRRKERAEGIVAAAPVPLVRTIAEVLLLVVPLGILAWIVGGFLGIPMAIMWVVVIVFALTVLMSRTTYGRGAYLLGANREAAVYSGINVKRTAFIGFLIMGALYGVASILLTARLGTSTPGAGQFLELDAIAAAVIGGVSLRGGVGTVAGAVMGALLLTTINNGMSILNISSFSQLVIKGLILVLALGVDSYVLRRSSR
jgi:D-xylose transport system permease protein